jgi:hypothetical protein
MCLNVKCHSAVGGRGNAIRNAGEVNIFAWLDPPDSARQRLSYDARRSASGGFRLERLWSDLAAEAAIVSQTPR